MKKVFAELDKKSPSEWVEQGLSLNADKEADWFVENTPEFYGSEKNSEIIISWLNERDAPITRRNLLIAYNACLDSLEQRPLEPAPVPAPVSDRAGIFRIDSTVRLPFQAEDNEANRAALKEELTQLRGLSAIGQPVSENLKRAYQESLQTWRQTDSYSQEQIRAARIETARRYPDLKRDGAAFNKLVGEHLLNLN